jgi:hypothetical protein
MTTQRNDGIFIAVAIGALVATAIFFSAYSFKTSDDTTRSAASTGSSTGPKAPNTLQDKATDKPRSTTGSDVPR